MKVDRELKKQFVEHTKEIGKVLELGGTHKDVDKKFEELGYESLGIVTVSTETKKQKQ